MIVQLQISTDSVKRLSRLKKKAEADDNDIALLRDGHLHLVKDVKVFA